MALVAELGEIVFDFAVIGEAAGLELREDQLPIRDYIELSGFARLDLDLLAEAGLERRGQTGRARLVASSRAVKDLSSHEENLCPRAGRLKL